MYVGLQAAEWKGTGHDDYTRCIGCWMCIMNCPFGAIERVEGEHVAVKCEGCLDRDFPPCAAACERGFWTAATFKTSHARRGKGRRLGSSRERERISGQNEICDRRQFICRSGSREAIREIDREGDITMISDEPYLAYARPLISYALGGAYLKEHVLPE